MVLPLPLRGAIPDDPAVLLEAEAEVAVLRLLEAVVGVVVVLGAEDLVVAVGIKDIAASIATSALLRLGPAGLTNLSRVPELFGTRSVGVVVGVVVVPLGLPLPLPLPAALAA